LWIEKHYIILLLQMYAGRRSQDGGRVYSATPYIVVHDVMKMLIHSIDVPRETIC